METRRRKAQQCIPWQTIPAEVMVNVFSYLTKNDQLNAGSSCRHWRDVSLMPTLWEERHFVVQGKSDKEVQSVSRYLGTYASYLKRLTISLKRAITKEQSQRVYSELREILNTKHYTRQQVHNVACYDWGELHLSNGMASDHKRKIQRALINMLENQESLSVVQFYTTLLKERDACQLLQALAASSSAATLTELTFHNFTDWCGPFIPTLLEVMGQFKRLERLGLDQEYLDDTILTQLISASPFFKELVINLCFWSPPILPDWQKAVRNRPELSVTVRVFISLRYKCFSYPYQEFLHPDMPLVRLKFHMKKWNCKDVEPYINDISTYIIHPSLKIIMLDWEGKEDTPWNRPGALVTLVKACPSLKHLSVQRPVSLKTILQVAAAAERPRGRDKEAGGGGGGGPSSATHSLQMHVTGCDTNIERVMESVSRVNPTLNVHICDGCQQWLDNQSFMTN